MSLENYYKETLVRIINGQLPGCHIWLFGSRARKTNKSGADIDLALDTGRPIPLSKLLDIQEDISRSDIPVFVDLIDINSAAADFLDQIKKDWIQWTT